MSNARPSTPAMPSDAGSATNDVIRTQVVRNYRQFVAEVDPRGGIMDHLIEAAIVSIETKERIVSHVTRQDRCRAVLDELLRSSHPQAFIVLQRALCEHYPWIVDKMNEDNQFDQVDSTFTAPCVREMARRLDEVEKNLRVSPTPSVERDLRRQIDDLRTSESQLLELLDSLTSKNKELQDELDRTKHELQLRLNELSDVKDEMSQQRRDAKANEIELRVQLNESIDRERLLNAKLEQAEVREKLLRQEVKQAVQDERSQSTSVLTSAPSYQAGDSKNQVSVSAQLLDALRGSSRAVYGVTVLYDELFVAHDRSNIIQVFGVATPWTSLSFHRRLIICVTSSSLQVRPLDIASCAETRSLYISDAANARLHRVDPASGRVLASWKVDGQAWGLSVTVRGTVVVCCRGAGLLCEYSSSGHLLARVKLPDDVAQPVHAVEVSSQFVVSHYNVDESSRSAARICVVDDKGVVQLHHDDLRQPHHLAALCDDAWSLVAVADCGNDRVKLLDAATLNVVAVISDSWHLRRPHRLCVRQGRLYVGQWDGRVIIYQLAHGVSSAASVSPPPPYQ